MTSLILIVIIVILLLKALTGKRDPNSGAGSPDPDMDEMRKKGVRASFYRCPYCGSYNTDGVGYCYDCGEDQDDIDGDGLEDF